MLIFLSDVHLTDWRKTWNRTAYDRINREFIGWHVLTYVAFSAMMKTAITISKYGTAPWGRSMGGLKAFGNDEARNEIIKSDFKKRGPGL